MKIKKINEEKFNSYDDMKSTGAFFYVSDQCAGCGYRLEELYFEIRGGKKKLFIDIEEVDKYASKIRLNRDSKSGMETFVAQTTAFGALTQEEYDDFADQVERTNTLLRYLNSIEWEKTDTIVLSDKD